MVLLNLYPPSQDAGNASGAIRTMWDPAVTNMAPALGVCIFLAATPGAVLTEQLRGEAAEAEAAGGIPFEEFGDAVDAIIHVINTQGVPLWNSGDFAGCARAYHVGPLGSHAASYTWLLIMLLLLLPFYHWASINLLLT